MGLLIRLAELLIVVLPLVGAAVAVVRSFGGARRQAERPGETAVARDDAPAPAANPANQWRSIRRVVDEHARTDARWLDYELDAGKLLDFPLMTDMRDPRTVAFHKSKLRAELLRPVKAEDLLDDRDAAEQYRAAVEDYVTAFDVAEAEAMRRRRTGFSTADQQRLARAQSLLRVTSDAAAAPQERQRAYERAQRELDGLLMLPATTQANIERGIAGELEG
ncbi:hypothetical protein A5714_10155 [Mycobacterium sp. E2462]|uniref:hypothetical protein n=1 Tax=Mycobacterium sp. E2462 TaxID=1834133 RepID=UPI0007FC7D33|nr:hypothetical protein [Mycobacterium sp. E2462]OBI17881.1 hypothetical protein A5714_10155 [Mycobacterium sp. E2462]